MENFKIEKYQNGQEKEIHQLIKKVYDEYVAPDYPDEGNRFFYEWIQPIKIAERQLKEINLWVATDADEIIGMIEIRDSIWLSLLFVDKKYHNQGIAKRLFQEALKEQIRKNPSLEKFNVHASPYSIPVYEKLGFVAIDTLKVENGISYLPMEMKL